MERRRPRVKWALVDVNIRCGCEKIECGDEDAKGQTMRGALVLL